MKRTIAQLQNALRRAVYAHGHAHNCSAVQGMERDCHCGWIEIKELIPPTVSFTTPAGTVYEIPVEKYFDDTLRYNAAERRGDKRAVNAYENGSTGWKKA